MNSNNNNSSNNHNQFNRNQPLLLNEYLGRRRRNDGQAQQPPVNQVQPPVNQMQRQIHNNRRGNEEFRGDQVVEEEEIDDDFTERSLVEDEPLNFCALPSNGVSVLLSGPEFNHLRKEIIALKRQNRKLTDLVKKRNLELETDFSLAMAARKKLISHSEVTDAIIQNFQVDARDEKEGEEVDKDLQLDEEI
jgi:hypothetical protein